MTIIVCDELFRTNYSQLLHSRFQGCRFQTEKLCRATLAANAPASVLEHLQHMMTLDFVEVLYRRGRHQVQFADISAKHGAGIEDEVSLDHIAKFADISWPGIFLKRFQRGGMDVFDIPAHPQA